VILGFQEARPGLGAQLSELNVRLGRELRAPGLLRYQALRHSAGPERLCVYWLWRRIEDREELWASPTEPLRTFWDRARPLWGSDPVVKRYRWRPAARQDLCPAGTAVSLEPVTGPVAPDRTVLSALSEDGEDLLCETVPVGTERDAWFRL
jgi:hypothetical protein